MTTAQEINATAHAMLPEPTWIFRRITVWAALLTSSALLTFMVWSLAKHGATGALERLAYCLIAKQLVLFVIYLIAPTQEYLGRISELVKSVKGG